MSINNSIQKILSYFIAAMLIFSCMPVVAQPVSATTKEFAGGNGTEDDPYLIETKEHLDNVRNDLDAHYKMIADIRFSVEDFSNGGAFYNDGLGWNPIGPYDDLSFTGVFDGNNFTIYNLSITGRYIAKGLFGYNDGIIKNLIISQGNISTEDIFVGAVAGVNRGTITNCVNESTNVHGYGCVGGIAGESYCGTITLCRNSGYVSGDSGIGGIAGSSQCDLSISNNANFGSVEGCSEVGGIVGWNTGSIFHCYNTGEITAKKHLDLEPSDAYWVRAIAGGIVGINEFDGTIINCYNSGNVTADSVNCGAYAGGIVGCNYYGQTSECYNIGTIRSNQFAGGILGSAVSYCLFFSNCYNAGKVSANFAGGIAGHIQNSTLSSCYNVGEVSADDFAGAILGSTDENETNYFFFVNCYFLDANDQTPFSDKDVIKKCSSEEMQSQALFAGFDFENTWGFSKENEFVYPILRNTEYIPKDLKYSIKDKQVTIAEYAGNLSKLFIPDTILGCPVTEIGDCAVFNCNELYSVVIPESITTIGLSNFANCSNLRQITIPNTISKIGRGFALASPELQYTTYDGANYLGNNSNPYLVLVESTTDTIRSCVVHPDAKFICGDAFFECLSLEKVTINEGVIDIGFGAFACTNISHIDIPNSVVNIGEMAFAYCKNLNSISFFKDIRNIGNAAFLDCQNLSHIYFCGTEAQWDSISIAYNNTSLTNAVLHYHDNSEYEITVKPTFSSTGLQQKTCSICGDVITEKVDMLVGKIAHWNISLNNDFAVTFCLQVSESILATADIKIIHCGKEEIINLSTLEKDQDGYYIVTIKVAAAQMNDIISIQVVNGEDEGDVFTYTIRQYCETILTDNAHSQYHALVKEMLNYGAMAQVYFGHNTDNLANNGITDDIAKANVPESAEALSINGTVDGISFYGASLVYRDRIAVRYYFTGDVTDCTFTANGKTYTPVAKDGMYYVEISDILPQDLDQQITLVVADTAGDTLSVSYGPMNYIVRMNVKGNENLQNLLKALYNYHLAAKQLNRSAA